MLDATAAARTLGVSVEAIECTRSTDVIDLHVDSFIWTRLFGYDPLVRHGLGALRGWFFRQADLPRLTDGGFTGATWVITTNPFRSASARTATLLENLRVLRGLLGNAPDRLTLVRSAAEYHAARNNGNHGAFVGIQGGNAFGAPSDVDLLDDDTIVRVTIVHLTPSAYGAPAAPFRLFARRGLSARGRELVQRLEARRILVDLAHIGPKGFYDALEAHDRSLPVVVTHTGVCGVRPHWRNLDDDQLRAVANTGGTIGIIANSDYLGRKIRGEARWIVDHMEHAIRVVGDDHVSFGSDFDGFIVPPRDLRSVDEFPRLVQIMLDRRWSPKRIEKVLAGNFLRVVGEMRG